MPKSSTFVAVLGALCLVLPPSQAQDFDPSLPGQQQILEGSEPMPEIIEIWEDQQYPWFVAVEKVFLPSGEFDETHALRGLVEYNSSVGRAFEKGRSPDGCIDLDVFDSMDEHTALGFSLEESVENAESVFTARVTGQRVGVQDTLLGSVFRIEVIDLLKGQGPRFPDSFCFLRGVEARVWNERVCSTNPLAGDLPVVGEEVLVLLGSGFQNREKNGLLVNPANIVPIRPERVRLGYPYYRDAELSSLTGEEFLHRVKKLLGLVES